MSSPMTNSRKTVGNKPRGRPFEKGNPGGPGRRRGSRNHKSVLLDKMLADDGEAVVRAIVEKAKAGDMAAAKMIFDRIVPVRRGVPVPIDLPLVESAEDVVVAQAMVLQAMGAGELSPEEAKAATEVIKAQRDAVCLIEIQARLDELERRPREV